MHGSFGGEEHSHRKKHAAFWSIVASAGLTLGKFVAALSTGSLALLSEAFHGLLDVAATTITYFAVREADKPADDEHHYGHGKIEAVAALIETGLLFALSAWVMWEACLRLVVAPHPVEASPIAFVILLVSMGIDLWRWKALAKVAEETRSDALAADALHFSSDLVSSGLALLGLGAIGLGFRQGDAFAAIGVSLFIAVAGWRLARHTLDTLLDAAPKGLAAQISALAAAIPGVVEVVSVRVRPMGGKYLSDLSVAVPRSLPLERVTIVQNRISAAIAADLPLVEAAIHAIPKILDDETILERIMLTAARRRIMVHHIIVQTIEDRLSVSFDLEVDGQMSLGAGHETASLFEEAIRDELGPDTEVETHLEPLRINPLDCRAIKSERAARLAAALAEKARHIGQIGDIHDVRVRETGDGLIVHYHCQADAALSIASVHAHVDELERRIRLDWPEILRVVGHAEPRH